MLYKIGLIIFVPFKILNTAARKLMDSETIQSAISAVFSILAVVAILKIFWPIRSGWMFAFLVVLSLAGICIVIDLTALVISAFSNAVIIITCWLSTAYDRCKSVTEIYQASAARSVRNNQKAEVTLQYFIAKEQRASMCYAKYLGDR